MSRVKTVTSISSFISTNYISLNKLRDYHTDCNSTKPIKKVKSTTHTRNIQKYKKTTKTTQTYKNMECKNRKVNTYDEKQL